MTPPNPNAMKKQKQAKVVTNIEAARNAHKLDQRQKRRKKEKQIKNKKSLRDKFRLKIEHGKVIKNDPDAFTNESQITVNQNTTLNKFNPHNPANFPTTKNEVEKFDSEIEKLEMELNNLNQYAPQINKIEKFVGVNKGYRHTKDFLNKHNDDYILEETMGYHDADEIEQSVDRLDDLLAQKTYGQAIPFVGGPARVRRPHQQSHGAPTINQQLKRPEYSNGQRSHHMDRQTGPVMNMQAPPPVVQNYDHLQFAKQPPTRVRNNPRGNAGMERRQFQESGEFVNTNPNTTYRTEGEFENEVLNQDVKLPPAPQKRNKFSNHVSIRDSLDDRDLALEEDPEDMVTFDADDTYDQHIEDPYQDENPSLEGENHNPYEIGAYKSHNKPEKDSQSPQNYNFQKKNPSTSISQVNTVYSEFQSTKNPSRATNSNQMYGEYPNTIQEVSAENLGTPQAQSKVPVTSYGKKKSLSQSIEEEFEESQEETVVKGYANRVKQRQKMKRRMEEKFSIPGKGGRNRPPKNRDMAKKKKEVVVETEHGNMMVKGGVDLKKLFLS